MTQQCKYVFLWLHVNSWLKLNSCYSRAPVPTTHGHVTPAPFTHSCHPPGFCSLQPWFKLPFLPGGIRHPVQVPGSKEGPKAWCSQDRGEENQTPVFSVTSGFLMQREEARHLCQLHGKDGHIVVSDRGSRGETVVTSVTCYSSATKEETQKKLENFSNLWHSPSSWVKDTANRTCEMCRQAGESFVWQKEALWFPCLKNYFLYRLARHAQGNSCQPALVGICLF